MAMIFKNFLKAAKSILGSRHLHYSHGEDFEMPFTVPNISIEFVSAINLSHKLSETGEGTSHCLFTYVLRKKM